MPITQEDIDLFREVTKDIRPLTHDKVNFRKNNKFNKINIKRQKSYQSISADNTPPVFLNDNFIITTPEQRLFFAHQGGLQVKTMRKFKAGEFSIEARLDLHGYTIAEAKTAIINFLTSCQKHKMRHILIIHGKGTKSSDNKITIKTAINTWLPQHHAIITFCSAKPTDGGTGAVYALLKKEKI